MITDQELITADTLRRSFEAGAREAIEGKRQAEAHAKFFADRLHGEVQRNIRLGRELAAARLVLVLGSILYVIAWVFLRG